MKRAKVWQDVGACIITGGLTRVYVHVFLLGAYYKMRKRAALTKQSTPDNV